ncbi:unnamed protein product [Phytophthora fragariaefolia]|uniref:Unnamed protein product n=1 Tax=Phytophthora fragariaefolia TaxID=1490495 RepID=A0A9W7DBL7_9STRA|nr:unnamed protein product [Phytophthora fragariaefolia]
MVKPVRSTLAVAKFLAKAKTTTTYVFPTNSKQNAEAYLWRTAGHLQKESTTKQIGQTNTLIDRLTTFQASIDKT